MGVDPIMKQYDYFWKYAKVTKNLSESWYYILLIRIKSSEYPRNYT